MIKEWLPSDLEHLSQYQPKEWLPFKNSHQQALSDVYKRSVELKDNQVLLAWFKGSHLLVICDATIDERTFFVNNILSVSNQFGLKEGLLMLNAMAKSRRLEKIFLPDFSDVSLAKEYLVTNGFYWTNSPLPGFYHDISYHTGIVLGGGGARGSYQIGAWRALRELQVSYDMVSGTSVGALNGAFMVQGNLEDAEAMWRDIATKKILKLSFDADENQTREKLIDGVKGLTLSALKENGVDSTPLYHMIEHMIDEDKLFDPVARTIDFSFVTTQAPKMEEIDVSLNEVSKEDLTKWLLASSSFYPAMKACEINGHYYVDGGYRNNVPKDLLLKKGATELIVVDVKGPGFNKPVKIPREVVETTVSSKWGLGTVLLFDKERASWNISLGYLETLKAFHVYPGTWYTLSQLHYKKQAVKLIKDFLRYLNQNQAFHWVSQKVTPKWIKQHHYQPEVFGVFLLEELANTLSVNPTTIYSLERLELAVVEAFDADTVVIEDAMLQSVTEWLSEYFKQTSPVTEKKVLNYFYQLVSSGSDVLEKVFDIGWKPILQAMFICFIKERQH